MTIQTLANAFANSFEKRTRNSGEEFYCLVDDAPDWMTEVVREAHAQSMPDDWKYRMIRSVAIEIDEVLHYDADANLEEAAYERIDSLIPVYNMERLNWLSSSLYRAEYVDDAMREGMAEGSDLFGLLACGIEREYREMWDAISKGLTEQAEEGAEEEGDED